MTFNPDSDLQREVAGQPDDWLGVVARARELADALPAAGSRAAVVGCGTSFFMAQAYAALREQAGQGETDAFAASEHRLDRSYDAVLVITRSGTTTEVIDVLTSLRGRHGPVSIATAGWTTWAPGEVPAGLAEQVRGTGAHCESRDVDPLAELVRVHRLCLLKARRSDLDPDHPRHLTRSVILPPATARG